MILDGSVLLDEELHKGWRQTVGTVWFQEGVLPDICRGCSLSNNDSVNHCDNGCLYVH